MTLDAFTPIPGVHAQEPYEEYHRWNAASNSRLSLLRRSPAHLRAYLDGGLNRTSPALELGRAIHTAVLEPDTFDSRYVVAEQCTALTAKKEPCRNMGSHLHAELGWLCGTHIKSAPISTVQNSKLVIEPNDRAICYGIRDSVYRHPAAKALLAGISPVSAEVSLSWVDPDTGIMCKARPDYVTEAIAGGALVDLKSAREASAREFERSIFAHGYYRQGAHYLDGAEACAIDVAHFVHIAVEKEPPYAVAVYRMRDDVMVAGRQHLAPLKRMYADCVAADAWPAYSDEVQDIALPPWAWQQMDDEVSRIERSQDWTQDIHEPSPAT